MKLGSAVTDFSILECELDTRKGANFRLFTAFMKSGDYARLVEANPGSGTLTAYTSLVRSLKKYDFPIKALIRRGELYVLRTDMHVPEVK